MRFKLDENQSRSVANLFRTAGHDVMTVRDQKLQGASDEEVFEGSDEQESACGACGHGVSVARSGQDTH